LLLSFYYLTPTPLPGERGYFIDLQYITPFFRPLAERGLGDEVKSIIESYSDLPNKG
jgi:hypothetical protein